MLAAQVGRVEALRDLLTRAPRCPERIITSLVLCATCIEEIIVTMSQAGLGAFYSKKN